MEGEGEIGGERRERREREREERGREGERKREGGKKRGNRKRVVTILDILIMVPGSM